MSRASYNRKWFFSIFVAWMSSPAFGQGSWQNGRATMYGADAWSIHKGSCGYGYIRQDEPLGWNVAALPDVSPDYVDSCGICFEVKCNPSVFRDGYGESLDRNQACYDPDASLVVRITDTCPCVYPDNAFSNKRWCCGDMPHFDLSIWSFERLADTKWGVIGLQYRRVPCSYQPDRLPPTISNPTPGEQPPSWGKPQTRDWPELTNSSVAVVYDGNMKPGWQDTSYNVQASSFLNGLLSGSAKCFTVQPKGAIAFKAWNGVFQNHISVNFFKYMSTNTGIDIGVVLVIGGDVGDCMPVDLTTNKPTEFKPRCTGCTDYWWKWEVFLPAFAGYGDVVINNAKFFKGCGGNTVDQLNYIEVRNYRNSAETICVDRVVLS